MCTDKHDLTADDTDNGHITETGRRSRKQPPSRLPVKCDICNKMLSRAASLRSHKQHVHAKDLPSYVNCGKCNKPFKQGRVLLRHEHKCRGVQVSDESTAVGEESGLKCVVCMKVFASGCALYTHKRNVHGINIPLQDKCSKCNKLFRYGVVLARHERNCQHDNDKESTPPADGTACNRCEKVLRSKTGLKHRETNATLIHRQTEVIKNNVITEIETHIQSKITIF